MQRLAMEIGDLQRALQHAGEAYKIAKHLADLDPGNVTNIQDIAGSAYMYGMALNSTGARAQAIQFLQESAVTAKALAETGRLDSKGHMLLPALANELFKLGNVEEASVLACLAVGALARAPKSNLAVQFAGVVIEMLDKLLDQRLNEVSEKLCDLMLPFCKSLHGEHSPEVAILLNFAGIARKRRNDLAGAEHFYQRAYDEIRRLHGPESPGALAAYRNLMWVVNKRRLAPGGF